MPLTRIDVRVPDDVRERIRKLAHSWPGSPTESFVVRYLLEQGLEVVERERPNAGGPGQALPGER